MTNYEKIKAMTVEEMAQFLDVCRCYCCIYYDKHKLTCCDNCDCVVGTIQYLESEEDEDD